MAVYPAHGLKNWDDELKAYIDAVADETGVRNQQPFSAAGLGPRVAFIGDSKVAVDLVASLNIWANSWATHFALASNGTIDLPMCTDTHGGYTSTQIVALLETEVFNQQVDALVEDMGTNDGLDGSNKPAQLLASLNTLLAACRARGVALILSTLTPSGNAALGAPSIAPVLVGSTTGGTQAAGTYQYRTSVVTGTGETLAGPASSVTTTGTTSSVTVTPPFHPAASSYNIYRSADAGSTWTKVGNILVSSGVRQFTDTGAAGTGTVPASDTTAVVLTTAARRKILAMNALKTRFATAHDLPLIDLYSQNVATDGSGTWRTGYTIDGTHPTPAASKRNGVYAWNQVKHLFRARPALGSADNADPANLFSNGINHASGTAPLFTAAEPNGMLLNPNYQGDNTTVQPAPSGLNGDYGGPSTGFVKTHGARAGHRGKAFAMTRTVPQQRFNGKATEPTAIISGHVYAVKAVVEVASQDGTDLNGTSISLRVQWMGSGGGLSTNLMKLDVRADFGPTVVTTRDVAPAGATGVAVSAFNIAHGEGTVAISEVFIYDLTDLGVSNV